MIFLKKLEYIMALLIGNITLKEMVIPSLNQFQSLFTGDAQNRVKVDTV